MPKLKSARHHWWPRCVSTRWTGQDGKTGWLRSDGTCIRVPPHQLGVIGNGHHIKIYRDASSAWDSSFEHQFDAADTHFPAVLSWLEELEKREAPDRNMSERFLLQPATDDALRRLTECVVSLAVRGPMNREASVAAAEFLRGPIKSPEREVLIGANMQASQRLIADAIGANGKFAVLFSSGREFIFGDGFFHNVTAAVNRPHAPMIVAPLTPEMAVIVARPTRFMVHPRLTTIILTDAEVETCNYAVQVYSRQALYFRSEQPVIHDVFERGQHLQFSHPDNPMETLIRSIPGVPDRDRSLDAMFRGR